jgi:hypothetical protein
MNRQDGMRRVILGAVVAMVAAATALGTGSGASATDGAFHVGGHGSKANFQRECKKSGGTFGEDGLGNTTCHFKNGSWEECDANGNDCWFTPPPRRVPNDPWAGPGDEVADDSGGTQTPPPGADSPAAPDEDQEQDTSKRKGKKGKKGGKGRK